MKKENQIKQVQVHVLCPYQHKYFTLSGMGLLKSFTICSLRRGGSLPELCTFLVCHKYWHPLSYGLSTLWLSWNVIKVTVMLHKFFWWFASKTKLTKIYPASLYCRVPPHMGLPGFGGMRTIKRRAPCMNWSHRIFYTLNPKHASSVSSCPLVAQGLRATFYLAHRKGRAATIYMNRGNCHQGSWSSHNAQLEKHDVTMMIVFKDRKTDNYLSPQNMWTCDKKHMGVYKHDWTSPPMPPECC